MLAPDVEQELPLLLGELLRSTAVAAPAASQSIETTTAILVAPALERRHRVGAAELAPGAR